MEKLSIKPNVQYERHAKRWQKIRDIIDGEDRLKESDLSVIGVNRYNYSSSTSRATLGNVNVNSYLRIINPSDTSTYGIERNVGYICGARLYNATERTLSGFMGMLFRVDPEVPEDLRSMNYLIDNVDGAGTTLVQQSQSVSSDVIQIGRDGLLVDMPRNEKGEITRADVANGFRAQIHEYKAESIIDWHQKKINGSWTLDLLVLMEKETELDPEDPLNIRRIDVTIYRVYRLDSEGVTVQVIRESSAGLIEGDVVPVKGSGNNALRAIPFSFVGSKDNQPCIDKMPLETVADLNLGHYQESANLASSSYQLSAAQPWVADDNYQRATRNDNNNNTIELGEESLIVLGNGGRFDITAAPANTMASELMGSYEEQMVSAGAQVITPGGQAETAEAARIKHASDVSVLDMISENVSEAYTKCLGFAAEFMGVDIGDSMYQLNRDFFDAKLTPDEINSQVAAWQGGAISKAVLDSNLKKGKVIPKEQDLEEMNKEIDEELPGLDLDGGTNRPADSQSNTD